MSGLISSGKTLRVQEFRASGTWTNPGVKTVSIFSIGGGGASGTSGGQAGRLVKGGYDVNGKSSCVVVIGAGGVAGNGGDTSFDGVLIAEGGRINGGGTNSGVGAFVTGEDGYGGVGGNSISYFTPTNGASANATTFPNSGAGGSAGGDGASGYLRVEWYE